MLVGQLLNSRFKMFRYIIQGRIINNASNLINDINALNISYKTTVKDNTVLIEQKNKFNNKQMNEIWKLYTSNSDARQTEVEELKKQLKALGVNVV